MLPGATFRHFAYSPPRHTVFFGEGCSRFASGTASTNIAHLLLSQLRRMVSLAMRQSLRVDAGARASSALRLRVLHVGSLVAEKQMVWPNARRVIAAVTNIQLGWNWTMMQFPTETMSEHALAVNSHLSVTRLIPISSPLPVHAQDRLGLSEKHYRIACKSVQYAGVGSSSCMAVSFAAQS
jgi:hypothetical protein